MKTVGFAIALALTGSAAAQAGTAFEIPINGGVARIQLDEDCAQGMCASISWSESGARHDRKDKDRKKAASQSERLNKDPAAAPASSLPAEGVPVEPRAALPPVPVPADAGSASSRANASPAEKAKGDSEGAAAQQPAPPPAPATVAAVTPGQAAVSAAKTAATSPVGEWLVEDGEARVRIEECGTNLCGIVSGAKNSSDTDRKNPDPELRHRPIIGLPVLLDMKPITKRKWEGQIYNAKDGKTYTASISLADPLTLRVEGCVFGGLICGGQNWTRVN